MRLITILLGTLFFSMMLRAENIHSPESFMPAFEGWKVIEAKPLAHQNRHLKSFWKKKAIPGGEQKTFRNTDGREGAIVIVRGVTLFKAVEVAKNHKHAAVRTAEDIWAYGEAGTASLVSVVDGVAFCLEDYVTKKTVCSDTITFNLH